MAALLIDKLYLFEYNAQKVNLFAFVLYVRYLFKKRRFKMADKKTVLTYEGLKKLEDELHELKVVRRKDVASKIKEARAQGDLSENAEYDAAKDEQADIENRITIIEKMLRTAEVIDEDDLDEDTVNIGSKVKVLDIEYNEEVEYLIVGSTESDPLGGKISNESPLGVALLSRKVGDTVTVDAPQGHFKYTILEIAARTN